MRTLVIVLAISGIILMLINTVFKVPGTLNPGIVIFSFSGILIGLEGIIKRKIILQSRYHRRLSETYTGIAAIAQGIIIVFIGCFLIGLVYLDYLKFDRSIFVKLVKHPGIALLFLSLLSFLSATVAFIGSKEEKETTKFVYILNLFTTRLLAGIILTAIGGICLYLGILEITKPEYFDSLGGGFLEVIFLGSTRGK